MQLRVATVVIVLATLGRSAWGLNPQIRGCEDQYRVEDTAMSACKTMCYFDSRNDRWVYSHYVDGTLCEVSGGSQGVCEDGDCKLRKSAKKETVAKIDSVAKEAEKIKAGKKQEGKEELPKKEEKKKKTEKEEPKKKEEEKKKKKEKKKKQKKGGKSTTTAEP
uniref:BTSP n=1 Tax=Argas monolakensis TaxID=34602 RepID=Q09JX4_ARGMO|nr:BTSP [Argas monolakensis]